jgi:hypothetical protein
MDHDSATIPTTSATSMDSVVHTGKVSYAGDVGIEALLVSHVKAIPGVCQFVSCMKCGED